MNKQLAISVEAWKKLSHDDKIRYTYNMSTREFDPTPKQEISYYWYEKLSEERKKDFVWDTSSQRYQLKGSREDGGS